MFSVNKKKNRLAIKLKKKSFLLAQVTKKDGKRGPSLFQGNTLQIQQVEIFHQILAGHERVCQVFLPNRIEMVAPSLIKG